MLTHRLKPPLGLTALMAVVVGALGVASCAAIRGVDLDGGGGRNDAASGNGGAGGNTSVILPDAAAPNLDATTIVDADNADVEGACQNLACQQTTCTKGRCRQMACPSGQKTTVTGVVFDPAGRVPLYNVAVFVPNAPLKPMTDGVVCGRCQATITNVVTSALTDVKGQFTLDDVPVGSNIPLVVQVGKWRRAVTIPRVAACTSTALPGAELTRLPRNQQEGDLPRIALTTGGDDALECMLRKIGIDDREFTPETGGGRVNLFAGVSGTDRYVAPLNGGAMFTPVVPWWNNVENLKKYDAVLYSCEGTPNPTNKSAAALQAFQSYTDAGGRVFASHFHNYWLQHAQPPLSTAVTFVSNQTALNELVSDLDVSFPKGGALADWLMNVGASTQRGKLLVRGARNTVSDVDATVAQRWIFSETPRSVQYLTTQTPVGLPADQQCGRVVFSDMHVSTGIQTAMPRDRSLAGPGDPMLGFPFPTGCMSATQSPQELALEFMLFDLSSCIQGVQVVP
jgi:hypothetical protein